MISARVGRDWNRRYPPLLFVIVALALAILALPSALNLPQANPGQTLEYAPVPGDSSNAPPGGNIAGLGLGQGGTGPASGGSGGGSGAGPGGLPPQQQGQLTQPPSQFNCVGSPPRQTEDPLSPPCVAYYRGDNGGSTYQGVTGSEVRVIYYLPGGSQDISTQGGAETSPSGACLDLGKPASGSENAWNGRQLRVLQTEFNRRYQTYNRRVHFFMCFDQTTPSSGTLSPEQRRQDAANEYAEVHPFAVVSYAFGGNSQVYLAAMAQKGVVAFSGSSQAGFGTFGAPESYYQTYPGLIWSYEPAIENRARLATSLVCGEVANRPVAFSGNPGDKGTRKLGILIYSGSSSVQIPEETQYGNLVKSGIEQGCGVRFADTGFKDAGAPTNFASNAALTMADFKQKGVTTVIDVGVSVYEGKAAGATQYRPEWIIAGDGAADTTQFAGDTADQTVWSNAFLMTDFTRRGPHPQDDACVQSALEGDPTINVNDAAYYYCAYYLSTRQLFTAIQVAGPRLTPSSIDQGFHAIPRVATDNSRVPTCFYDVGDYTCVKDTMLEWWDKSGTDPEFASNPDGGSSGNGCWRMVSQGQRSLIGQWPSGEISARKQPAIDACNGQY